MVNKPTCKCELCDWNRVFANPSLARSILQGVEERYQRRDEFEAILYFVVKRTPVEHIPYTVVSGPHIDPPNLPSSNSDEYIIMHTALRLT